MPLWGWIVLVAIALLAIAVALMYNGLVRLRNAVDEAWHHVSVQLKRRHDLIPNLVEAVKGYMEFEQETLAQVVDARNAAVSAHAGGPGGAAKSAQAENLLAGALRQLLALMERYPELRANQNVLQLQQELAITENQIAATRERYNVSVREFNTAIERFPAMVMAGPMGFVGRTYFTISEPDAAAPEVGLR
jgi:LemA protein